MTKTTQLFFYVIFIAGLLIKGLYKPLGSIEGVDYGLQYKVLEVVNWGISVYAILIGLQILSHRLK